MLLLALIRSKYSCLRFSLPLKEDGERVFPLGIHSNRVSCVHIVWLELILNEVAPQLEMPSQVIAGGSNVGLPVSHNDSEGLHHRVVRHPREPQ